MPQSLTWKSPETKKVAGWRKKVLGVHQPCAQHSRRSCGYNCYSDTVVMRGSSCPHPAGSGLQSNRTNRINIQERYIIHMGYIKRFASGNWLTPLQRPASLKPVGQAGNSGRGWCCCLEAEFLLLWETSVLLLRPSPDWMRPAHMIQGLLFYLKPTDCGFCPHLPDTFGATPRWVGFFCCCFVF